MHHTQIRKFFIRFFNGGRARSWPPWPNRMHYTKQCDSEADESPAKERYTSKISTVTLEQNGSVRTVVRVQGSMLSGKGQRLWLPFNIRMYFYAGSAAVRLVHTVIFDSDDQKDFIKGSGLVFTVPLREEMHNRHVRFAGEGPGI